MYLEKGMMAMVGFSKLFSSKIVSIEQYDERGFNVYGIHKMARV